MRAQKLQTGAFTTNVYVEGEGEPVLFIHGSGPGASAYSNWHQTIPELTRYFLCIAPDLVGFNESDHPDPPPIGARKWMRIWVTQLLALLDALGARKAHLVGNSLGGAVALHLLMEAPDRFLSAVLMGPVGSPFRITLELDRLWGFYEDPSLTNMKNLIRWFIYDDSNLVSGEQMEEMARNRFQAAMRPEVRRSFEAMWPRPRQEHLDQLAIPPSALKQIQIPVLIVHGIKDNIVPIESSLYLASHLPNASVYLIARTSHWVQLERRTIFNNILRSFLQRIF